MRTLRYIAALICMAIGGFFLMYSGIQIVQMKEATEEIPLLDGSQSYEKGDQVDVSGVLIDSGEVVVDQFITCIVQEGPENRRFRTFYPGIGYIRTAAGDTVEVYFSELEKRVLDESKHTTFFPPYIKFKAKLGAYAADGTVICEPSAECRVEGVEKGDTLTVRGHFYSSNPLIVTDSGILKLGTRDGLFWEYFQSNPIVLVCLSAGILPLFISTLLFIGWGWASKKNKDPEAEDSSNGTHTEDHSN